MKVQPPPSLRHILAGFATGLSLLSAPGVLAADDEAWRAELRQLATVYEAALGSGDLSPLAPLFTPESSGVVVDNQPYRSLAELQAIYDKFRAEFPGVIYRVKLNPEPTRFYGDIAVARGTGDEFVKTGDGEFTYTSHWTIVLQRVNGQWKLIRSQVTMDPFRNSVVQFFLGRSRLYYGGGALIGGLLLGFVIARLTGARKTAVA